MQIMLSVHIIGGTVGLVSGFMALFAAKGAKLHRSSGTLFFYAMLTLGASGAVLGLAENEPGNVVAGLLTATMVVTALTTVRPRTRGMRWLDIGAMLVGLPVGLLTLLDGLTLPSTPESSIDKVRAPLSVVIGISVLLCVVSDLRMIRSGGLRGGARQASETHVFRAVHRLGVVLSGAGASHSRAAAHHAAPRRAGHRAALGDGLLGVADPHQADPRHRPPCLA